MKYPETDSEHGAMALGKCPACGADMVDLRGTNQSQFTLRAHGRCNGDGQGYECNKDVREKAVK